MKDNIKQLKKYYNIINPYISRLKGKKVLVIAFSIINIICAICYNWTLKIIVDDGIISRNIDVLIYITILYIALVLLANVSNILKSYLITHINQKILVNIRLNLYNHVLKQPYEFFNKNKSGDIIYRMMNDVNNTQELIFETIVELLTNILTVVLVSIWLFSINWKFTLIIIAFIPIYILISDVVSKKIYKISKECTSLSSETTSIIHESILGIETIKIYTAYKTFADKLNNVLIRSAKANTKNSLITTSSYYIMDMILKPLMAIYYLIYGIILIKYGTLSLGELLAYSNYFWVLFPAAVSINSLIFRISSILPNVTRVLSYFDSDIENIGDNKKLDSLDIDVENLTFSYDKNSNVLNNVNLKIKPGTSTAIIGKTGCGKTSLIKLLIGFYKAQYGEVRYGKKSLWDYDIDFIRNNVYVLTQDSFFFNMSIKDNLMLEKEDITMDEIIKCTKVAQIYDFIISLPKGFDTIIGENGVKLSGGERQRMAMARVLIRNPKIIIMDEPTSALDNITENKLWFEINKYLSNCTRILVTHNLELTKSFDNIVVLNQGEVVQKGSYCKLEESDGLFKSLLNEYEFKEGYKYECK